MKFSQMFNARGLAAGKQSVHNDRFRSLKPVVLWPARLYLRRHFLFVRWHQYLGPIYVSDLNT